MNLNYDGHLFYLDISIDWVCEECGHGNTTDISSEGFEAATLCSGMIEMCPTCDQCSGEASVSVLLDLEIQTETM